MAPSVSVAIVNWNTRELLRGCLKSLPWEAERFALEVMVVDNGSEDGSPEMVAADFPQVRLLRNTQNLGFVKANNQGLEAAAGDYLFMLNSDTEVQPGCIERLLEVAAGADGVGVVGPLLLNADGTRQESVSCFPSIISRFLPGKYETRYQREVVEPVMAAGQPAPVDWMAGAALLFSRQVLERVGPPDERFFMWWDDIDWCQKLRRAGLQRLFVPDAVILHHGRMSTGRLDSRDLAAQLLNSEYLYLRLNSGWLGMLLVYALRMSKALLRWLLPAPGFDRSEAAFRLAYHWRNLGRLCFRAVPPSATPGA